MPDDITLREHLARIAQIPSEKRTAASVANMAKARQAKQSTVCTCGRPKRNHEEDCPRHRPFAPRKKKVENNL